MRQDKKLWAVVAVLAGPIGAAIAKFHVIAPTPGMFFALGVLATLCIGGIVFGVRDARRVVRSGQPIGN